MNAITRLIVLSMQNKDFGHDVNDGSDVVFETTSAKARLLELAAIEATERIAEHISENAFREIFPNTLDRRLAKHAVLEICRYDPRATKIQKLAKLMADRIGHGMTEKCWDQAAAAVDAGWHL